MEYKVSVIMPSLNVADYIRECMDSVIGQMLQDIEIICVDAGSTDGTFEIIEEYAARDVRVKVLKSSVKSYGYQMNLGIAAAQGEYIGIVETDDLVSRDMYGDLYGVAKENDLDFVKADFYRFTTDDGKVRKNYYHLTNIAEYKGLYNKVFCPEEHLEAFSFVMNTWSGIYRRKYLTDYDICHNESAGASFQDNGFWFQTFMYARRAMFVDRPYYMNRRDNPNSSVFSKNKVYAVCDEYAYIREIMQRDKRLYGKFIGVYWKACFDTYFFNLNRISPQYSLEFTRKMSEDFRGAMERGELDRSMFEEPRWREMMAIMEDPGSYHMGNVNKEEIMLRKLKQYNRIIIYGAGSVGRKMLCALEESNLADSVICFAVTDMENNLGEYNGVKVERINELLEYRENATVLVAVTEQYRGEIEDNLKRLGFRHIVSVI